MNHVARDPQDLITQSCWHVIGVRGNKSCPALAEHAHCRNCPVFSQIAATLFERPSTDGAASAQVPSAIDHATVADACEDTILVFRLGAEWLGVSMSVLDEVVELRTIHTLPHRPNPILLGIANVRGELVVCVSMSKLLGIGRASHPHEQTDHAAARRLMILRSQSGRIAVPVDEIQHTLSYGADDLVASPATVAQAGNAYSTGLVRWRDRTVARIDANRVITAFEGYLA